MLIWQGRLVLDWKFFFRKDFELGVTSGQTGRNLNSSSSRLAAQEVPAAGSYT
jgi:hypothetical protein